MFKTLWNFMIGKAKKIEDVINESNEEGNTRIAIDKAKKTIKLMKDKLTKFMAECVLKESSVRREQAIIDKYNEIALKAHEANDEKAVQQAFEIVEKSEDYRDLLIAEVNNYKTQISDMKIKLEEAQVKVNKAERDLSLYASRVEMAKARKKMSQSTSCNEVFDINLDGLEKQAEKLEAQAKASEELNGEVGEDTLKKYEEELPKKSIEERLQLLKG